MKKLLLFCVAITLSGCATTVPVTAKFPEAPEILLADCEKLEKIGKDKVLFSEFLKTVVGNYNKYHMCAAQNAAWKEWYKQQKEIFDNISKEQ
jgi:uncharacterized lipoprotein YmbA